MELVEPIDALLDRDEVGEEAAEPALIDEVHPGALGLLGDGFLSLLLGPDEEDLSSVGSEVANEYVRLLDARQRLLEVDDVDPVPLHEDEALHLRVPAARLVPEVDPGLQQLLHGDNGHVGLPFFLRLRQLAWGRRRATGAEGEGRSDREGVRDIRTKRPIRYQCTRIGTPGAACERRGEVRRETGPARHVAPMGGSDGGRRARGAAAARPAHGAGSTPRPPRSAGSRRRTAAPDATRA